MGIDQPLLSRTLGGRFRITSHIGEGAMASVFRGVDVQRPSGGDVAIKVMHPHLATDRTFTARFKREAEAASMVKHPNSVAILDVGEEQGIHYIVMELCLGRDLRDTLKFERRLAEPRAVRIMMTICDALHVAHGLGVVHRDLKPENVMVLHDPATDTDGVKVLDFGIAKLVDAQPKVRVGTETDSDPPPALTQFGVVVGTPQYMSPEQCRGQPLDGRSDIYTCGILLYQLVTGALPFNSESPFEVAGKQAFEQPPPPRTHFPEIDPELEAMILRTLAKSPDERPQSAQDLKDQLGRWLNTRIAVDKARAMVGPGQSLKQLGRTMPLAGTAQAIDEHVKGKAVAGPFMPTRAPIEAPATDMTGSMGTSVSLVMVRDDNVARPPTPAAGRPAPPPAPNLAPSPPLGAPPAEPAFGSPPLPQPQQAQPQQAQPQQAQASADGSGPYPPAPTPLGPGPGMGHTPLPAERAHLGADAPRAAGGGWGLLGFFMILLSLLAGVAVGFGLYRYAPF